MNTIASGLARYINLTRNDDFPALARSRALDAITDCIACMLAGSREPLARILLDTLPRFTRTESTQAPLLGTNAYSSVTDSALYNGTIAHALDYDDTNHPAYAHPSAALLPAMLAVAPQARATGQDLITAYILGFELIGKLGRALNPAHMARGWHPTATLGTLGAAVAAGRLLRLNEHQLTMALGIAASAAGGFRANFGTMTKPLHAGYAARNGALAALLASHDFTSSETALEHAVGFCNVMNESNNCDLSKLDGWGIELEILTEYGLALKPYPSCGATHTGIEAALLLRDKIGSAKIETVRAGVSDLAFAPLIQHAPTTPLEAKFSLRYCIAAALTQGVVGLRTFSDDVFKTPAIQDLLLRVSMESDDRVRDSHEFSSVVTIRTSTGEVHENLIDLAIGKPSRWFSPSQLRSKFNDCASLIFPPPRLDAIFLKLRSLDSDLPVPELCDALRTETDRV